MTKGKTSKLDYLTHHEAGHAAVAFSFRLPLGPIRIDQDDDSGTFEMPAGATDMQQVLIALAGGRAERRLDPSFVGNRQGAQDDEAKALAIIHTRFYGRHEARCLRYIDDLVDYANDRLSVCCALIVEQLWPDIQRLAAVLVQRRELSGAEAEKVLAG